MPAKAATMDKRNETLRVSFRGDADEDVHRFIVEQADALERLYGAFTHCHVIVKIPEGRDGRYRVTLYLTMLNNIDVCIDCHGPLDDRFCDPKFAVAEVFRHARRLIGSRPSRRRAGRQTLQDEVIGDPDQPASSLRRKHR
jgi:hypothetical protein